MIKSYLHLLFKQSIENFFSTWQGLLKCYSINSCNNDENTSYQSGLDQFKAALVTAV